MRWRWRDCLGEVESALLQVCRTPELGGHLYQCPHCRAEHFVPHSCRNRHCPSCRGANSVDWLDKQAEALLPIPYFHLVFTLPHELNALIQYNQAALYDRGELQFGGCVEPLASPAKFRRLVRQACRQKWVVYAKRPFAAPEAVLGYLSRYTHRVGITNRRLLSLDAEARTVRFAYKDYADDARRMVMNLGLEEFVRRVCLHILPPRFVKIRHYGILSTRNRTRCVQQARTALGVRAESNATAAVAPPPESTTPVEPPASTFCCPHYQKPGLILIRVVRPPRPPPPPDDTS